MRCYVEALETRIRDLERTEEESSLHRPLSSVEVSAANQLPLAGRTQQATIENDSISSPPADRSNSGREPGDDDEDGTAVSGVDAMGTSSTYLLYGDKPEQPGPNYFGPSSTVSFLSLVRQVISRTGSPLLSKGMSPESTAHEESSKSKGNSQRLHHVTSRYRVTAFHVPPRREADVLMANYWTWVHTMYPILHKPTFDTRYQALWQVSEQSQTTLEDILFHCRLNVVFALAAHFRSEIAPLDRRSMSETFFSRSEHLLPMELLDFANLEMVQSLVLMAQYLQSTDKPNYCWSIVGLAIRMAQAIGLHLDSPERVVAGKKYDQVDVEVRKRVWSSCILLDRVLAMTYGRPLMMLSQVSQRSLHLPSPIDDEYLTNYPEAPGKQPDGKPSMMACYSQTLMLQEILGEILSSFYQNDQTIPLSGPSPRNPSAEVSNSTLVSRLKNGDFQDLFRLEGRLSCWYDGLPSFLKVHQTASNVHFVLQNAATAVPTEIILTRQANALRTRWLHVRLFLFRPALLAVLDQDQSPLTAGSSVEGGPGTSLLHRKMLSTLADLCIQAAEESINLIYSNSLTELSALSAWWYNVFYLHNCAIVILIALQCPCLRELRQESDLQQTWRKCLQGLEGYKKYSDIAKRSHRVLQMIDRQIVGQEFDRQHPSVGIIRSLAASPGGGNGIESLAGAMPTNSAEESLTAYGWPSDMQTDASLFFPDGDFWMGDSGDVSWLSTMPFVTGMS
ncbi:hypothetical protein LTR84_005463 [Exophiala bonariae]|uniref:Xylanolytic transcriptional activator regulatory domain-containing protein n=1 Tax=Exophiala bonariae TaxID=1690606 RepID=A0AAV9N3V8_9EURO|nr:hypothetical protein LTR84_005463 [Exophiala bonariae]